MCVTETAHFSSLSYFFFFFSFLWHKQVSSQACVCLRNLATSGKQYLGDKQTTVFLFLSLSAFQYEHSGLGTFHIESKEITSFLHFNWMLGEEGSAVHALIKSASELLGSEGNCQDKVREAAEVLLCTEPLQLDKFFSLPCFQSFKPD